MCITESGFDWEKFATDIRKQMELDFKELSPEEYQMKYFGVWEPSEKSLK